MMPPSLLRIYIEDHGRSRIRLWLPVIVLWPIGGFLGLLILPVFLLASGIMRFVYHQNWLLYTIPAVARLILELRGLRICVSNQAAGTKVQFIID